MVWRGVWRRLACCLLLLGVLAAPQRAAADTLLSKIVDKVSSLLPHDQVEMAKYTIAHPENSLVVYEHAAEQDYPFFAIIGGMQATRDLTKGKFGYAQCVLPITLINSAFDKVDAAAAGQGQDETQSITGMARSIAADYEKEASAQVKAELLDELNALIPYFSDLQVMCHFAMNTRFNAVTDFIEVAGGVAQSFVQAYHDFDDGDIADGVADLMGLGLSASLVCSLADDLVSGGVIHKIPLIGDLATGACEGAVKFVLDAGHWVVGLASDAGATVEKYAKKFGCAAVSLFSDACDAPHIDWPAVSTGLMNDFCAAHGGAADRQYDVSSRITLFDNDYQKVTAHPLLFYCQDLTYCATTDRAKLNCAPDTAALLARRRAIQNANKKLVAMLQSSLSDVGRDLAGCLDDSCSADIRAIRQNMIAMVNKTSTTFDGEAPRPMIGGDYAKLLDHWVDFNAIQFGVQDYLTAYQPKTAAARVQTSLFANGPRALQGSLRQDAAKRCPDDAKCRAAIGLVGVGIAGNIDSAHQQDMVAPYDKIVFPIYALASYDIAAIYADAAKRRNQALAASARGPSALIAAMWARQCRDAGCRGTVAGTVGKLNRGLAGGAGAATEAGRRQLAAQFAPLLQQAVRDSRVRPSPRAIALGWGRPSRARLDLRRATQLPSPGGVRAPGAAATPTYSRDGGQLQRTGAPPRAPAQGRTPATGSTPRP